MATGIYAPLESVADKELHPDDILSEVGRNSTTGLNPKVINPNGPKANDVFNYLKTLNYAPLDPATDDIWDCLERAIWGVAHARHRFPGSAMGVAEGTAKVGPAAGKDHAVVIVWEKGLGSFIYWDPLVPTQKLQPDEFGPVVRIEAFPSGVGQGDIGAPPAPIEEGMTRIGDGDYVCWKTSYKLYPLTTDPKITGSRTGVLDYLNGELYKIYCVDIKGHPVANAGDYGAYWGDWSRAYWSYIHVRRIYEGCAIGVAFGKPAAGNSTVVNVLWHREGGDIKRLYFDPSPEIRRDVTTSFTPRTIFF